METIQKSYRGLSLLMDINWDRALSMAALAAALATGAYIASL